MLAGLEDGKSSRAFTPADAAELGSSSLVRIAAYPLLTVSRSDDWGWRMANRFVEFYTTRRAAA